MPKPDFARHPNGKVHPITPKKGAGAVVAAAVLAGGVAAAGGGAGSAGTAGSVVDSVASQGLRAKIGRGKAAARKGRQRQAWQRLGWRQVRKRTERAVGCAARSYGQVQEFLLHTPCRWMRRTTLTIADGHGNTVAVAVAWVRMGSGE